jgi:riboflavin kinase
MANGVYFGWAVVERRRRGDDAPATKGRDAPFKARVNVGFSPTFEGRENKERIVEAHLITRGSPMTKPEPVAAAAAVAVDVNDGDERINNGDAIADEIEGDFYGERMRLQLIGYLRPEQKFDSFPELVAQIHRDISNAKWTLDSMPFVFSKEDEFVKDGGVAGWTGSGGGDVTASWAYELW